MSLRRTFSILRTSAACKLCVQPNSTSYRNFSACSSMLRSKRNTRDVSTYEMTSGNPHREGIIKRLLNKIPINFNKKKLTASGYFLYEGIADTIDYFSFFKEFSLPDTFYSWFVVTELHVWMLSARVMAEGDDGRILRNGIVEALWCDVQLRTKKVGAVNPSSVRSQISELSEQLQAALIAYDEGIFSDDVVLAGALWRRMYQYGPFEPEKLELLVKYVRKHMNYLDSLPKESFLQNKVRWEPLPVRK